MEDKLTVNVHCADSALTPIYRLYVNSDLIAERTFIWDHTKTYITENLLLNLPAGKHKVWISADRQELFQLRDATLNQIPIALDSIGNFTK